MEHSLKRRRSALTLGLLLVLLAAGPARATLRDPTEPRAAVGKVDAFGGWGGVGDASGGAVSPALPAADAGLLLALDDRPGDRSSDDRPPLDDRSTRCDTAAVPLPGPQWLLAIGLVTLAASAARRRREAGALRRAHATARD